MTNTKFRKRALLSSVAMLLVALVALGSATFAWFSTTNTASASSMTAKTNKASNILLNEYNTADTALAHSWAQTLTFTQNTAAGTTNGAAAMEPVTTKDFSTWNNVKAEVYNQGYNTTNTYTDVSSNIKSNGSYVKYTTLYIMNTGENTAATINTAVTYADDSNTLGSNYIRVALIPRNAGSKDVTAKGNQIIFGDGNDRSKETAGWTEDGQTANSVVTGPMGTPQSLGTLTKDAVYGYDVYVYFEGTDFDCKDAYAGGNFNITFNVAKTA
nr:hypothetical protein [uncultured Ruminococcus sp.]